MRNKSHFQGKEAVLEKYIRRQRVNRVKKLIPKNSRVLDIGCGYNAYFLNQIKGNISKGVGLDFSVKKAGSGKITLKSVYLEKKIPEKNSSFETITALAIIEHLKYPQEIINELARVTKPGGTLIITTPNKSFKPLLEFLALTGLLSKREVKDHKQYFDKKSLQETLVKAGFVNKNIRVSAFMLGLGMNLLAVAKKD